MRTLLLCLTLLIITSFSQAQAVANPASDLTACSDTEFSQFDLNVNDTQIIGDQNNVIISYHTSQADADNNINPLISPFTNTTNPQTIFARAEDTTDSTYDTTSFIISVGLNPVTAEPIDLILEDVNEDGTESFDLSENTPIVLNGLPPSNYDVVYFETESDALADNSAIVTPNAYSNLFSPQTIYIRVTNFEFGCFTIENFDLVLTLPDSDNDGISDSDEDLNSNGDLNDDDTDEDDIPNYLDDDDDGDGVDTLTEITGIGAGLQSFAFIDTDEDLIENYLDNDDDGDGVLTIDEDYNNNGSPLDDDTDNSGVPDFLESNVSLSIKDNKLSEVLVYPNPSTGIFNLNGLKTNDVILNITDIFGKTYKTTILNKHSASINLKDLPSGIYFLQLEANGFKIVQKIIKQ
jgi:hypothetical protein